MLLSCPIPTMSTSSLIGMRTFFSGMAGGGVHGKAVGIVRTPIIGDGLIITKCHDFIMI